MSNETATIPDTFTFASQVDHAPIFVRKWLPPCGIRPRALVQITHGIAEHSGPPRRPLAKGREAFESRESNRRAGKTVIVVSD